MTVHSSKHYAKSSLHTPLILLQKDVRSTHYDFWNSNIQTSDITDEKSSFEDNSDDFVFYIHLHSLYCE